MSTRDRLARLENDIKSLSARVEHVRSAAARERYESVPDPVKLPTIEIEQFGDEYRWRVWRADSSLYNEGYTVTYKKARKFALDEALGALFGVPDDEPATKVGKAPKLGLPFWKAASAW